MYYSHEYSGHARTEMFSSARNCLQIPTTWGCALSCCNMRCWSWMTGTTTGLRISSWYLCALTIPSKNAPLFTVQNKLLPIHNVGISKLLTDTVCHLSWTVKTGIHLWREELARAPSIVSVFPFKAVMMTINSKDDTPKRTTSMQMSFSETFSGASVCEEISGYANQLFQQQSRKLVSDDLGGEHAGHAKFSESPLESAYGRENSTHGQHLWRTFLQVSMPVACSLKTCDTCGIELCDKTAHFRVAKAHLCNNHAV